MNQLKITDLEFIDVLSTNEHINLTGGLDVDLDADLDVELDVLFHLGEPTLVFGRSSGASAGAFASSKRGTALAQALAQA